MTKPSYQKVATFIHQEINELSFGFPFDADYGKITDAMHELEDSTGIDTSNEAFLIFISQVIKCVAKDVENAAYEDGHQDGYNKRSVEKFMFC